MFRYLYLFFKLAKGSYILYEMHQQIHMHAAWLAFCFGLYACLIFILRHWLCHFDSTFFKDFHRDLARIVKHLLSKAGSSEAIFLSPKRGYSLDLFLEVAKENSLHFSVMENYDEEVWKRHKGFLNEDRDSWPSYDKGHSYPLLIRITLWNFFQTFSRGLFLLLVDPC